MTRVAQRAVRCRQADAGRGAVTRQTRKIRSDAIRIGIATLAAGAGVT